MPPRRSTRAASTQPQSQTTDVSDKPAARGKSTTTRKRNASPARDTSPAPKRTRTVAVRSENVPLLPVEPKPAAKTKASQIKAPKEKAEKPKQPAPSRKLKAKASSEIEIPQAKPYFNPLPRPRPQTRPGLQLFVWGTGNFGQFGMGPDVLSELNKPKRNTWIEQQSQLGTFGGVGAGLETVAAGGLHSVFIDEKGSAWTCGVNDDAALGRVTKDVPDPDKPGSFLDVDELTSIPHPLPSLIDENFRAVQVVAGDSICAALSAEGDLRVWGSFRGDEGSLGFASGLKHQFKPTSILELPHKPGDVEKVSSIAAGANHVVVLTTHGHIYTWGAGEQSQLGRKVLERRKIHGTVPEKVTLGTRGRKAVAIGTGSYHSFAVDDKGDVWGWGLNSMGQLGTGYGSTDDAIVQLPRRVQNLSKEELGGDVVKYIEGGAHHTLFLTAAGKVYACGRSNGGQLGLADDDSAFDDRIDPDFLPEPALVTFPDHDDPIATVSTGPHYCMAITEAGAMYSWGQGTQGELGAGDEEEIRTPRVIVRKEGGSWAAVAVACGGQHALGLFKKK